MTSAPDNSRYDLNCNGYIDIGDLAISITIEVTTMPYPRYDVKADESVDILDAISVGNRCSDYFLFMVIFLMIIITSIIYEQKIYHYYEKTPA